MQSIQGPERLQELIEELKTIDWDTIFVTETWRAEREEVFDLAGGHLFVGSGGQRGSRGVAILVGASLRS